ncbi:MAG: hypothetical protein OHK006_24930 [Thermodesulfovibrionales bacterium]
MARPIRIEYDGAVYHVTSRGNARKPIFEEDADRIETPDANLSKGMRQLDGLYTQSFNKKHKRVGHIFQGRYKAILIEKESHLLEVCRYVVLNPMRAKAVQAPGEWKWSSYNATAGKAKPHRGLTVDWV